jgi:hypothetical protein
MRLQHRTTHAPDTEVLTPHKIGCLPRLTGVKFLLAAVLAKSVLQVLNPISLLIILRIRTDQIPRTSLQSVYFNDRSAER